MFDPKEDRYWLPVLDVCEDLHAHMSGTSDPVPPDVALKYYEFLKMRLGTWQPSCSPHVRIGGQLNQVKFDKAVQDLVVATLEMYESGFKEEDESLLLDCE